MGIAVAVVAIVAVVVVVVVVVVAVVAFRQDGTENWCKLSVSLENVSSKILIYFFSPSH